MTAIYHISPGYTKATAWRGNSTTGRRVSVATCTPNKDLTRRGKYAAIAEWLKDTIGGVPIPAYDDPVVGKPPVPAIGTAWFSPEVGSTLKVVSHYTAKSYKNFVKVKDDTGKTYPILIDVLHERFVQTN